jgi:hypothetical protein
LPACAGYGINRRAHFRGDPGKSLIRRDKYKLLA